MMGRYVNSLPVLFPGPAWMNRRTHRRYTVHDPKSPHLLSG